eukprot:6214239-Pleurochrysis_carterae.AAC.2
MIQSSAVGERARVRGLDAPVGWLRVVARSGCVGHARYGIPELKERSTSAPQVRIPVRVQNGNCACGPKEQCAATLSNKVLATRAKRSTIGLEAKKENNRAR